MWAGLAGFCCCELKSLPHAIRRSNSLLAKSRAKSRPLQSALPEPPCDRHRANGVDDSAEESATSFRDTLHDTSSEGKTFDHCARDHRAHFNRVSPKKQEPSRQERLQASCQKAWPAGDRFRARPRNPDRPDPRALHGRRAVGIMGQCHAGRNAALSGRSGMAVEDDSRCPRAHQTWIRPQPRSPAESRKCHDDNARRASGRRS